MHCFHSRLLAGNIKELLRSLLYCFLHSGAEHLLSKATPTAEKSREAPALFTSLSAPLR